MHAEDWRRNLAPWPGNLDSSIKQLMRN